VECRAVLGVGERAELCVKIIPVLKGYWGNEGWFSMDEEGLLDCAIFQGNLNIMSVIEGH
jgi:hypothetical protein